MKSAKSIPNELDEVYTWRKNSTISKIGLHSRLVVRLDLQSDSRNCKYNDEASNDGSANDTTNHTDGDLD